MSLRAQVAKQSPLKWKTLLYWIYLTHKNGFIAGASTAPTAPLSAMS